MGETMLELWRRCDLGRDFRPMCAALAVTGPVYREDDRLPRAYLWAVLTGGRVQMAFAEGWADPERLPDHIVGVGPARKASTVPVPGPAAAIPAAPGPLAPSWRDLPPLF